MSSSREVLADRPTQAVGTGRWQQRARILMSAQVLKANARKGKRMEID